MKKVYDVCIAKKNAKGEYIKNKDGKSIYRNIGSVIQDDKGYLNLVLETMHGDIWASLFEVKDKNEKTAPQPIDMSALDDNDNIPF